MDRQRPGRRYGRRGLHGRIATAPLLLLLTLAWGTIARAQDTPAFAEPTESERATVDSVIAVAEALATTRERVSTYHAAFRAAGERGRAGVAIALVKPFRQVAKALPTERDNLAAINDLLGSVPVERFDPQAATHFEMAVTQSEAYVGNVTAAERRLLSILARSPARLHDYTAAEAHYTIAYCGYYSERLDRAAAHITAAAERFEALGQPERAYSAYDGAAATYLKMGQPDSALLYARRALAIDAGLYDTRTLNLGLNYAEALKATDRPDSALHYATLAVEQARALDLPAVSARANLTLGNISMSLRRYGTSQGYYREADAFFRGLNDTYHRAEALDSLGRAYAQTADFEAAYHTRTLAFHLRDSLREDRLHKEADTRASERARDDLAGQLAASEVGRARAEAQVAHRGTECLVAGTACVSFGFLAGAVLYRRTGRRRDGLAAIVSQG